MDFTLTIPDAQVPRLVAAVAQQRGFNLTGMSAAQRAQMVKDDLRIYWLGLVQASEVPAAEKTARDAAIASVASGITVT